MRKSHPLKISIRVDFEGEDAKEVESVLKHRGLKNYSELARQLFSEERERMKHVVAEVPVQ